MPNTARVTVIAPKRAAYQFVLTDKSEYFIGRADENDIVIQEPSVSRQHARLVYSDELWLMTDLNSMNGLSSNGIAQQCCYLEDGTVVVVGNVPVLFSAVELAQIQQQQKFDDWRYQQAQQLSTLNSSASQADLQVFLSEALKLCQMERAGLLLGSDLASLTLHSCLGVSKDAQHAATFFGSMGALQTVLTSRSLLVANDISQHQALSQRASINIKQLSALACLPLIYQDTVLGLFYVDSQKPSKYLTAFDLELLQTLADNLTLALRTEQLAAQLQKFSSNSRQFN